jgi:hypothetical protein
MKIEQEIEVQTLWSEPKYSRYEELRHIASVKDF